MTAISNDTTGRATRRGPRRALKVLGALGVCAALGVAPALAAWSTYGTGTATPVARTLATPAAPTTGTATATSLVVNGSLPGGQPAGTAYTLKRGAANVCTPTAASWTCTDTGLTGGTTYSYILVSSLGAWTATSAAGTGTTTCATADAFDVVAPASVTAGLGFSVQVTRKNCDGSTDTTYVGAKTLTFAGLPTSPSGKVPTYPVGTTNFVAGTATVSIAAFKTGAQTLTISQAGTSGSASLTVVAGAVGAIGLSNAVSGGVAVAVTCDTVDASRTCVQSGNGGNANTNWSATVTLLDTWGNTAVNTSGGSVPVTFTAALGMTTPSGVAIANGASSANFVINMGTWTWIFGSDVTIKVAYNGTKQIAITLS